MRILTLVLALAFAPTAHAADWWRIALLDDGTYFSDGGALQIYPDTAKLADGQVTFEGRPLEVKGVCVELVRIKTEDLPEGARFMIEIEWDDEGGKPKPSPREKAKPDEIDDPVEPVELEPESRGRGRVGLVIGGGVGAAAALAATLFGGDRCVGIEESGPSTCLSEAQEPFAELVGVRLKDVEMDYKINASIIVEQDKSGKIKPKKVKKPKRNGDTPLEGVGEPL